MRVTELLEKHNEQIRKGLLKRKAGFLDKNCVKSGCTNECKLRYMCDPKGLKTNLWD